MRDMPQEFHRTKKMMPFCLYGVNTFKGSSLVIIFVLKWIHFLLFLSNKSILNTTGLQNYFPSCSYLCKFFPISSHQSNDDSSWPKHDVPSV